MIVVDGNDGTGKSTLVASLRALGYEVQDRGLPTKATDDGVPPEIPGDELFLILDVPEAVSLERLEKAGKDMTEHWHQPAVLAHYRRRFQDVAAQLGVPLFDAAGTPENVLAAILDYLKSPWKPLQVGVPKGRLFDEVARVMETAGYRMEVIPRNYHPRCEGIHPFILKPRSIPQMVALGLLDVGFCGRDLVVESGYDDRLMVAHDLKTQRVRLLAASANPGLLETPPKRPLVIATEFPLIADRWATARNLAHICINTWGSTEAWAPTYADLVIDVVETGETLAANGLTILDEIMDSTTVAVVSGVFPRHALHHRFISALRSLEFKL